MNLLRTAVLIEFANQQTEGRIPSGSRLREGAADELSQLLEDPRDAEGLDFSNYLTTAPQLERRA